MARYNQGEAFGEVWNEIIIFLINQKDLYEVLEVDSSASPQEIRKQFKKLAIAW